MDYTFTYFSRAENGIDFLDGLGFHAIFTCYLALYVLEKSTRELNRTCRRTQRCCVDVELNVTLPV